jgi:nitric oxide reductase activation protein
LWAAAPRGLALAIDGFCSYGRRDVRYTRLKDFEEPASRAGQLGPLTAAGSTRLGAAVRHATGRLTARRAGEKLLLVITDGEPADVDVYDERYLVEDARVAVEAARRAGIAVFGCCLPGGAAQVPQRVFGSERAPLARLAELPARLSAVLSRRPPPRTRSIERRNNPKEQHGHANQGRR